MFCSMIFISGDQFGVTLILRLLHAGLLTEKKNTATSKYLIIVTIATIIMSLPYMVNAMGYDTH